MGLMDNIKKAQEMAQQAAQGDPTTRSMPTSLAAAFQIKADPDDTSNVMLYGQA